MTPERLAAAHRRELTRLARPASEFDASRYFRGDGNLGFYNIGTSTVRAMGKACAAAHRGAWTMNDAVAYAEPLMGDRFLEAKGLALETLACFRREFSPKLLPILKRWLASDYASNWATTDAMCGMVLGPLLIKYPELIPQILPWSRHRNLWVRRASIVALLPPVRKGLALDQLYDTASVLLPDTHDLIHKAVGWALREAGKKDPRRLERYLDENGPGIPRTTVRYAIERFPAAKRREWLVATRAKRK